MTPERPGTAADLPDVIVPARDYAEMLRDLAALRAERDRLAAALRSFRAAFAEANKDGDGGRGWDALAAADDRARQALTPASGSEGGEAPATQELV